MKHPTTRIPVKLSGQPGVRYSNEPLTFGVPFVAGTFPAGSKLRCVTADGRELPLQTAVMTTWKPDLKHIKWLLADVQADPVRDGETVWLEEGGDRADRTDQPDPTPIAISRADGILMLDTGALRLTLRTDFPRWKKRDWDSPFVGCEVRTADGDWREALHGPGLLLYMKDQNGTLYTSLAACPAPKVVIEEQGPLRVCVLITGHLASAQGVRFCPYRLRLHLYAGKADLRLFHTFIFDQDPTRIELSAVGLKVCAKAGDDAVAAVGGEESVWVRECVSGGIVAQALPYPHTPTPPYPHTPTLSLLQSDDLHYTATRDGALCDSGEKASGWASLGGADVGVVAAVRDFWQEYPKGFRVTPDALDIGVWPEDAPSPLSFLTPFREPPITFNGTRDEEEVKRLLAARPTAPLDLQSFAIRNLDDLRWVEEVTDRLAPDRAKSYCDFLGVWIGGIGAAKTTEVVLRFSPGPVTHATAAAFAASVQEPLAGIVDPAYLCATRAFGHFLPAGHPRFADLDRFLTGMFDRSMMEPLVRCRRYGMFLHGQMVNAHTGRHGPVVSDLVYHLYKDTAPEKALRYVGPYGNEAMDLAMGVWGQFFRTGERRYLRQAQLTARAIADVSFVHAYPGDEDNIGCIHYHGAHVWSNPLNRSHSVVGAFTADYYLTGNRRSREVALEAADGIVGNKLEPCGIVNCFSRLHREFTGPLSVLFEAYQLTWHEKYGDPAQRSLNWLLRAVRTPGWLPGSIYTRGPRGAEAVVDPEIDAGSGACNTYYVFEPALRLFPSRALQTFLQGYAEHKCREPADSTGIASNLCLAYDLTGKREYAAAALAKVSGRKTSIAPDDTFSFYSFIDCDLLPRLMKTVLQAAEADPDGFWEFARQWRETQAAMPAAPSGPPPEQKPGTSLGVLSTFIAEAQERVAKP